MPDIQSSIYLLCLGVIRWIFEGFSLRNYNKLMGFHGAHTVFRLGEGSRVAMLATFRLRTTSFIQSLCREDNFFLCEHESRPVKLLRSIVWVGVTRAVGCIVQSLGKNCLNNSWWCSVVGFGYFLMDFLSDFWPMAFRQFCHCSILGGVAPREHIVICQGYGFQFNVTFRC